jgi:general secretion pathway protein A
MLLYVAAPMHDKAERTSVNGSASASDASGSLIYEPFYGLREKAFSLSADPRFLFRSPAHAPAFDALLAGIRRREGLIVLTGEIGTGKTTLCRSVLQHLDRRTFSAFVPDPFVSREDLLKTLLLDFGVISLGDLTRGRFQGASRSDLSFLLYEFLDSLVPLQAFAVLVIDEAQNLSLPLLEEIRILSELERREKLLQVVLVGQPELRSSLKLPQMRQVNQRVSVHCELTALDAESTARYVNHRVFIAGVGESWVEFTPDAIDAIHQGSGGVPRLINRICDRALARGYTVRSLRISASVVWGAIDDLGLPPARIPDRVDDEAVASPGITPPPSLISPQPSAEQPLQFPAPAAPAPPVVVPSDADVPQLVDFFSEADQSEEHPTSVSRSSSRYTWVAGLVASILAFSASLVGVAWYLRTQTVEATVEAPLPLVRPRTASSPPVVAPPLTTPAVPETPTVAVAVPAAAAQPAERGSFAIVVASFSNRTRAERLVEELASAGYRASAVERDWGPPRGVIVQVNVEGYTSAIDVQRDLQRIRELPGGYGDARIVER